MKDERPSQPLFDDQFEGRLALVLIIVRNEELAEVMPAAPGSAGDGLGLEQIGSGTRIAEGGDAVAEGRALAGNLEVLHEREMIARQFHDRGTGAGDDDQHVGWMGVSIGCHTLGGLDAYRQGA